MDIKKRKINYVCLESLREGQAAHTHVSEITLNLKKLGWNVEIYCPTDHVSQSKCPHFIKRVVQIIRTSFSIIRKGREGIFYIRWHPFSIFISLWAKRKGIPTIIELNGSYEDLIIGWPILKPLKKLIAFMFKEQMDGASHIIAVTEGLAASVNNISENENITVINNGVNIELFSSNVATSYHLPEKFVIFFGAFCKWHGIVTIIEATKEKSWPKDVKMVFVGDGILKKEVLRSQPSSDKIIYLGKVPYTDMPGIIGKALVSLVPIENVHGRANLGLSPLKMY